MRSYYLIAVISLILISCKKNEDLLNEGSKFADTIDLKLDDCTTIFNSYICFDSVVNDSRCPKNAMCVWEGNATIKITIKKGILKHSIELNTHTRFQTDTTIENLNISLIELSPNPDTLSPILHADLIPSGNYKAKLSIVNLDKVISNASVIDFNPEKCMCCWGWTIKKGSDTIKSDDEIIGKKLGYDFSHPVNVYIELGEPDNTCINVTGKKYYKIKQLIKTK